MAHSYSGKAGTVTFGGGVINGKLQNWELELTGNTINDRGAGENWASRIADFSDWTVRFIAFALDQADRSLSSATAETALINATSTVALMEKSTDTNPRFTATGICTSIVRRNPLEAAAEYTVEVQCSEGVAPTMDTTPLT